MSFFSRTLLIVALIIPLAHLTAPIATAWTIDHTCTDLSAIPHEYLDGARGAFRIWYGHTSHGNQITVGITVLQDLYGNPYSWNEDGSGGALSYQETYGDLGHNGDLAWETATREQLDAPDNDRNVVMWSWCGGVSDNTPDGINTYLNAMNQLEQDYPGVHFIYMTGHLDGSGTEGILNQMNNLIRTYCASNNKTLFDFADIESYDPDGDFFMDRYADDGCNYDGGNWAMEWCSEHSGSDLCTDCSCDHSQPLNCNLKGRAFWWMMARMAGWQSGGPTPTPPPATPTPAYTPVPSPTPGDCGSTGVILWMPSDLFHSGEFCSCTVTICNMEGGRIDGYPLFVILEINGIYFFAPDFSSYSNYLDMYPYFDEGPTVITVIPDFQWPAGTGSFYGAHWYAALTNTDITELFGDMSEWEFSWDSP